MDTPCMWIVNLSVNLHYNVCILVGNVEYRKFRSMHARLQDKNINELKALAPSLRLLELPDGYEKKIL